MTDAPETVRTTTVDPDETAIDEEGVDKSSVKASGTEHLDDAPEEAVQHRFENGFKQEGGKLDVTMKEERDSVGSNLENSGSNGPLPNSGEEGSENFGSDGHKPEQQLLGKNTQAVNAHISEPLNHEEDETPGGTAASSLSRTEENDSNVEVPDKETPTEGVGNESSPTSVQPSAIKEDDSYQVDSAEKVNPETGISDEVTRQFVSSKEFAEDSGNVNTSPENDETYQPVVSGNDTPVSAESEKDGSAGEHLTDTAVENKDGPEEKAGAEDEHIAHPGAQQDKETSINSRELQTTSGADEEINREERPSDIATIDDNDETRVLASTESTSPEVKYETDADTKVKESAPAAEPRETSQAEAEETIGSQTDKEQPPSESSSPDEEPKHDTGLLEAVGDRVVSVGSVILDRTKGLVGLGKSADDAKTGGEGEAQSDSVDSKSETETADETETSGRSQQPTIAGAEEELRPVDGVPTTVTVGGETQDQLSVSVPKDAVDEEDIDKGLLEVQPTTSGTEEDDADEPYAAPREQNSSVLQNQSAATNALSSEGKGEAGRSLNVALPVREAGQKKPTEESASYPSTPTTPGGTPLIRRVEQLEKKLAQFEDKQNSPKSLKGSAGPSTPRSGVDRPSRLARHTLEETLSKGSLLDRVAALERKLAHLLHVSGDLEVSPGTSVKEELTTTNQPESTDGMQRETVKAALRPLKLDFDGVVTPESEAKVESRASEEPEDSATSSSKESLGTGGRLGQLNAVEESKPAEDAPAASEEPVDSPTPSSKESLGTGEKLGQLNGAEESKPAEDVNATSEEPVDSPAPSSKESLSTGEKLGQLNAAEESKPAEDIADVNMSKATEAEEPGKQTFPEDAKGLEDAKSGSTTAEVQAQTPVQTRELPAAATKKAKTGKSGGPVTKLKARLKGCFTSSGKNEVAV